MNDFEIQRGLRQMNAPRAPDTDLWPAIAARIDSESVQASPRKRGTWWPLAAAAGVLLALATGLLMPILRPANAPQDIAAMPQTIAPASLRQSPVTARDAAIAQGRDPRLAGASVVLDAAQAELAQAIEQRPDAVFLVSLLNRTNAQRMKLDNFGARAG